MANFGRPRNRLNPEMWTSAIRTFPLAQKWQFPDGAEAPYRWHGTSFYITKSLAALRALPVVTGPDPAFQSAGIATQAPPDRVPIPFGVYGIRSSVLGPIAPATFRALEIPIVAATARICRHGDVEWISTRQAVRPVERQEDSAASLADDSRAGTLANTFRQADELARKFRMRGGDDGIEALPFA